MRIHRSIAVLLTLAALSIACLGILTRSTRASRGLLVGGYGFEVEHGSLNLHYRYRIGIRYVGPLWSKWYRRGIHYERACTQIPGSLKYSVVVCIRVPVRLAVLMLGAYPALAAISGLLRRRVGARWANLAPVRPTAMTMARSTTLCIRRLAMWFILISFLGYEFGPRSLRSSFPHLVNLVSLCLIPIGALHAAKYRAPRVLYFLYGCGSSWLTVREYLWHAERDISFFLRMQSESEWRLDVALVVGTSFILIVGPGVACRLAERWRHRISHPYAAGCCQKCGYDLQRNVSGVCPECGTPTPSRGTKEPDAVSR